MTNNFFLLWLKKFQLVDYLFVVLVCLYFGLLANLIHAGRPVDPDFFQFLHDSRYYLSLKLPPSIQSLPGNPILIGVFSEIFKEYLTELETALWMNAFFASATMFFIYLILTSATNRSLAWLVTYFLMSHPILFRSAISNNTEVLFSLVSVVYLYLAYIGKFWENSFFSAIMVLVRYESLFLFPSTFIANVFRNRFLFKQLILFSIVSLAFLAVLLNQNIGNSVESSPFIVEIFQRKDDVPEFRYFSHLGYAFFMPSHLYFHTFSQGTEILVSVITILILFLVCLRAYLLTRNNKKYARTNILLISSLSFSFLYLLLHALFPAFLERYFVPVIYSLSIFLSIALFYILNFLSVHKILRKAVITVLFIAFVVCVATNTYNLKAQYQFEQSIINSDYGIRLSFSKFYDPSLKYLLVTPYPDVQEYFFSDLSNVEFIAVTDFLARSECSTLDCAFVAFSQPDLVILVPYTGSFDWAMDKEYDNSLVKWYEEIGLFVLGEYINNKKMCFVRSDDMPENLFSVTWYRPCFWQGTI